METNKYFTPDIEEMFVGCEFEMHDTWGDWKKLILTEDLLKNPMVSLGSGNERAPWYWKFRVPYLTKEQIETEGWKYIAIYGTDKNDNCTLIFEKSNDNHKYELSFHNYNTSILIEQLRKTVDKTVREKFFKGKCKDINTLRKICKLLGI